MSQSLLADVCDVTMGQAPAGKSYNNLNNGLPLLSGASDLGELRPCPKKYTTDPGKVCEPGDIILCIRATIGDRNWADRVYCLGRGVAGLRPKPELLESRFLWHWLSAATPRLLRRARGSTFTQVTRDAIASLAIDLPPLDDQRHIATILDKADSIRRTLREGVASVRGLAMSWFRHRFGRSVTNPNEWPVVAVGDIADVQGGLQVTVKRTALPIEAPYLRVANVFRDRFQLDDIKTIRVTASELERTELRNGDVLVVEGHGNSEEIGRAAVWDGSVTPCTHQNHLIRVRVHPDRVTSKFLAACLNAPEGRAQMARFGKTTSGLNTISTSNVRAIRVPLPPLDLQEEYGDARHRIGQLFGRLTAAAVEADRLFEALSHRAFSEGGADDA